MDYRLIINKKVATVMACTAFLFSACSDEENSEMLPQNTPIMLQAAVNNGVSTHAQAKDNWTASDEIAVSNDGGASHVIYTIGNATTGSMIPGDMILYWEKMKEQSIDAWYPATDKEYDLTNQAGGYAEFDLLASNGTFDYVPNQTVKLKFNHLMAKVKCTLVNASTASTTRFHGFTKAAWSEGSVMGSVNGLITPASDACEALLVPKDMTGIPFITITKDGKDYIYTPKGGEADLKPGNEYSYRLTLNEITQTLVPVSITADSWGVGEATPQNPTDIRFYLDEFADVEHVGELEVSVENATAIVDNTSYTVKHNSNISISLSADEGHRLDTYKAKFDVGTCTVDTKYDAATRKYTYIFSDFTTDVWVNLEAKAGSTDLPYSGPDPQVGDYYYADGTWSNDFKPGCIAMVFYVGLGSKDTPDNYDFDKINGYAVALTNGNGGEKLIWSKENSNVGMGWDGSAFNGYSYTDNIIKRDDYNAETYPAAAACVNYIPVAPSSSSGWFLPSINNIAVFRNVIDKLGDKIVKPAEEDYFWTSHGSTDWNNKAYKVSWKDGKKYNEFKNKPNAYVRPMLTF